MPDERASLVGRGRSSVDRGFAALAIEKFHDVEFIRPLYKPVVKSIADFLARYREPHTRLPAPSYDLWEERRGISAFTVGAVWAGLTAAARFTDAFGEAATAEKYRKAASEMRDATERLMYDTTVGRFARMANVSRAGEVSLDMTIDTALTGLWMFGMFDHTTENRLDHGADDRRLTVKTPICGIARYENTATTEFQGRGERTRQSVDSVTFLLRTRRCAARNRERPEESDRDPRVVCRACAAERRVAGAGRSVHRRAAFRCAADVESRLARAGGASDRRAAQRVCGDRERVGGGPRLKRMHLRTRVLLLTAAFALTLFAITFFLASRSLLWAWLAVAWIVAMCSFAAVQITLRRVVSPLENLARVAEKIAEGDLTAHAPVAGDLEIARLGESFNNMADKLRAHARHDPRPPELSARWNARRGVLAARDPLSEQFGVLVRSRSVQALQRSPRPSRRQRRASASPARCVACGGDFQRLQRGDSPSHCHGANAR
jgi:HAMP domain-containing protein